jgi:hypothetical protein
MNLIIKARYEKNEYPGIVYVWGNVTVDELIEIEEGLPETVAGVGEDDIVLFTVYSQEEGEYDYVFRGIE